MPYSLEALKRGYNRFLTGLVSSCFLYLLDVNSETSILKFSTHMYCESQNKAHCFDSSLYLSIFIRPSKTGRIMSCRPSVCLCVRQSVWTSVCQFFTFSCPLYNSDTVKIFS